MQQCPANPVADRAPGAGVAADRPTGVIPPSRWSDLTVMHARVERGERVPP